MNLYVAIRWLLRIAVGFYFRRIETFHPERVPASGPVLFASNHPNSLTDSFILGLSVPRKVHFVATVQLFHFAPLKKLLLACGVIPINRVKDDPRGMRTVLDTFEACFKVLERGEAVGIFPEGITHDDPQLKTIKTGAARMALELEQRHRGKLGLQIVPVGLTFSAKEKYRSDALAYFGEPLRAADFLEDYEQKRHERIRELNSALQTRMQSLVVHLPQLERERIVSAVKRLYLDELIVSNRVIQQPANSAADELVLTQAIVRAVNYIYETQPAEAAAFETRLADYGRLLAKLKVTDDAVGRSQTTLALLVRTMVMIIFPIALAPLAIYGWLHRAIPVFIIRRVAAKFKRTAKNQTPVATTSILAGLASFVCFYCVCVLVFYHFFGFPAVMWYVLSLPISGIVAHWYLELGAKLSSHIWTLWFRVRAGSAALRLAQMREDLIARIEAARAQVPAEALAR